MNLLAVPRSSQLLLLALLVLPCPALPAQEVAPPKAARLSDPDLITVDFAGGPLSKLTAKLNESGETKLSIIQSAGLDPTLPAFSVRHVRIDALIAALGQLLEPQGFALGPVGPNLAVLREAHWTKPPQAFASLQIEVKLGEQSIEAFIATLQAACEFVDPNRKASTLRFKYHPSTKLLFVTGAPLEIDVVRQVFDSLPNNSPAKAPPPAPNQ